MLKAGWSREEITTQHLEVPLQAEIMEAAGKWSTQIHTALPRAQPEMIGIKCEAVRVSGQ